jgi:xanthine dehydrogenase accessory factor
LFRKRQWPKHCLNMDLDQQEPSDKTLASLRIMIRGAGEMASGIAARLYRSNVRRILMTDVQEPLAVRRSVSFCEAIRNGTHAVEGIRAQRVESLSEVPNVWMAQALPVIVDHENIVKDIFSPDILVDAVMAKKNTGTRLTDAPLVIGLGPGFVAGKDVHCVVETNRGHSLGRLLYVGSATPDTGIPGSIGGHTADRVLRAPCDGVFRTTLGIGDHVQAASEIGKVADEPVTSQVSGVLRGLGEGLTVTEGLKIGDVDPRGEYSYCFTVSEKARSLGGSVLEAILARFNTCPPNFPV